LSLCGKVRVPAPKVEGSTEIPQNVLIASQLEIYSIPESPGDHLGWLSFYCDSEHSEGLPPNFLVLFYGEPHLWILEREIMWNLKLSDYLCSKIIVNAVNIVFGIVLEYET
jgi:hypothetical protein